jgi:hypothetical protein
MIEYSSNEFYTASSGEGSLDLPVSRRLHTGTSPTPTVTTQWPDDAPTTQTMMIVPPWTLTPWPDNASPPEWHTFWEGQRA